MNYHSHSDRPILPAIARAGMTVDSESVLNQATDTGDRL